MGDRGLGVKVLARWFVYFVNVLEVQVYLYGFTIDELILSVR